MKYDFDNAPDRRNTGSYKWNVAENELPMWVADMDFQTAPEIIEALKKRTAHGVFGYGIIPDEWYEAYISWWERRHNYKMKREWLVFCTGVVPAISSIVRKLTTPNENVVIMTPVYNIFFNSIINNGCRALESPLKYEDGKYLIDFVDLEKKLSDSQTSLLILCNPQNPTGNLWSAEELSKIGELCEKYGVTVISDEIHCDIVRPMCEYVPFQSVSETNRNISIACIAPTKAFNIAGMQTAAVCVPDRRLRHKVWRGLNTDEVAEPNSYAVCAASAAFNEGEEWLSELNAYLFKNRDYAEKYIKENIPEIKAVKSDSTYLLWLDASEVSGDSEKLSKHIRKATGLYITPGAEYGSAGEGFLRLNMACPISRLKDGLSRLREGIYSADIQSL